MPILIARLYQVFFEDIFFSNIENDVTPSKISFLSLLPRECLSRYFFENFFDVCKANTNTDKSSFLKKIAISCCDVGYWGFKL